MPLSFVYSGVVSSRFDQDRLRPSRTRRESVKESRGEGKIKGRVEAASRGETNPKGPK